MTSLFEDSVASLRRRLPEFRRELAAQVSFMLLSLGIILAAVAWGLRETELYLVQTGIAGTWEEFLTKGWEAVTPTDLPRLGGRTVWGLVFSLLLPVLTVSCSAAAIGIRLAGVFVTRLAPRARVIGWIVLGIGVAMLVLDMLF